MTKDTVNKLEEVFAIGGTDEEACFYADISKQTLYSYQEKHPEFTDRKEALKQKPFLKARQTIIKSLDQPNFAFEYMRRKKKDEFSDRAELTGRDGERLTDPLAPSLFSDLRKEYEQKLKEKLNN